MAFGRVANTPDLGLEAAGVKTDERDYILLGPLYRPTARPGRNQRG